MISRLWSRFDASPFWVKALAFASMFYAFVATTRVWSEERPIGGFAEEVLAMLLVDGSLLGALIGGPALGMWIAKRMPKHIWFAWVAGLIAFVGIGSIRYLAEGIPGVGWRVAAMNDAEPVEY